MREFMGLYRGKRIDNGEWMQGCLITPTSEFLQHKAFIAESLYCGKVCDAARCELMLGGFAEVDPNTVGECCGLRDKNGKLIFEGDIVEGYDFDAETGFGVVELYDGAFEISNGEWCGTFHANYNGFEFEIIGNIHDNPELLKGGEGDG